MHHLYRKLLTLVAINALIRPNEPLRTLMASRNQKGLNVI